ncbi:MAG: PIN domain-containing protein [Chloroflexota bacterium]|nr:PIN domain-containing protein [Chloroflexota bacterium]
MTAFVDTSAFYAAADRGDVNCERAMVLIAAEDRVVTSDHVLVETWSLLKSRLGHAPAERFWDGVRSSALAIEHVGPADLESAWATGEIFADQGFSIVDRTSFAVMQRLGVYRAVSFDVDFAIFRFGPRRERAFEVLR